MKKKMSFFLALGVAVIWGASFVATKVLVTKIPPASAAFLRFLIAYIILFIIAKVRKDNIKIAFKDRLIMILMGLSGVTLYFLFENYGMQFTSAANASLIIATVPIFTVILNKFILKDKISELAIVGIIISLIGIYILIFGFRIVFDINLRGDAVMFLSVFSWVGYTYLAKKVKSHYNIITVTKELTLYGTIFFIPFVIYEVIKNPTFINNFNTQSIIALLYLSIVCSALAYLMWNKALKDEDSHLVNSFIYIIPLFSIITESLYLRTLPSLKIYISALLVVSGLFLTHNNRRSLRKKNEIKTCP